MSFTLATIWPLSFLVVAVIDDLWFRKFHNWVFLSLTVIGFLYAFAFSDLPALQAIGGFVVGGLLMLPLVIMGATGAGDMKFMMCFGVLVGTITIFEIFVYALFWGAIIGIFQSVFSGKLSLLLNNLKGFAYKLKPTQVNKIPYTIAIFFGWLSHQQFGGLL